jgi:tricorn protease
VALDLLAWCEFDIHKDYFGVAMSLIDRVSGFYARLCAVVLLAGLVPSVGAVEPTTIKMPQDPVISPDGEHIAFAWMGEIWTSGIDGADATRLTNNAATESSPLFSPDGSQIAFVSNRTGSSQIFVMNADGTGVRQITFHSAGYALSDWFPDGRSILALGSRDHYHRDATRLLKVNVEQRAKEQVLADAMVEAAKLSPDGKSLLFTREGERWWRKGYEGERSSQVWKLDLESGEFSELLHEGVECMWPIWMPDGEGFYFTKGSITGFELWSYRFAKKEGKPGKQKFIFAYEDDSIVYPSISSDGKQLLFRHLFDLYVMDPTSDEYPEEIELTIASDVDLPTEQLRREIDSASEVAFTTDGLEIAFVAGGDIWVMDTTLREPKQVTSTPGREENLLFNAAGDELWFTTVTDGQPDIWKATREDEEQFWWQNQEFVLESVTSDAAAESGLQFTPDQSRLVYQEGRGSLSVLEVESGEKETLLTGFSGIEFDLSADSQWIAYSQQDDNFNREIWITKLDGSMEPVNVSRHPDNDGSPTFSPDGKILAFTGRRVDQEVDIYYVYLQEEFDDQTSRQRKLEEALELMNKKRKSKSAKNNAEESSRGQGGKKPKAKKSDEPEADSEATEETEATEEVDDESDADDIQIDLKDIHERVRRISIPNSYESGLLFSPDGSKLAFTASIDGKRGWYTVEFPDELTPKFFTSTTGRSPVWSKAAGGILCSISGTPAKIDTNGKVERYSFEVAHEMSRSDRLKAGFEKAWLTMREVWYDSRYANKNWSAIRRKYIDAAAAMPDTSGLAEVIQLMLGELNGSHLGFYPNRSSSRGGDEGWSDETAHLGLRFEEDYNGPGLLVRDVIQDGPSDKAGSRVYAGDIVLAIDGQVVDPDMDLTKVLNGRLDRDILIRVQRSSEADDDSEGEVEVAELAIRPISFSRARSLLYEHWLDRNRQAVEDGSEGRLGYLHIRAMNMSSFYEFERQLYNVGYGKDGLVIDVRDNGGGSTTDLLLTALTQPRHAITVPRGGGQGYPQDRAVFASWSKPIIVLCNQNSYSNAEIFSHAIKTLKRGKVVGVQTAGGVVSTGSATIDDVGRIRVPFRGWFLLNDGQDMERNGCLPDETIWPMPGELPAGIDRQLDRAVELLLAEVEAMDLGDRELTYASERDEAGSSDE